MKANSVQIGQAHLTRQFHTQVGKSIQFLHTKTWSGKLMQLSGGQFAIGCSNIAGAGRGYVYSSKAAMLADLQAYNVNYKLSA